MKFQAMDEFETIEEHTHKMPEDLDIVSELSRLKYKEPITAQQDIRNTDLVFMITKLERTTRFAKFMWNATLYIFQGAVLEESVQNKHF